MPQPRFLYLVILIEGYIVLATELLTIRSLIPFVGSGVETISVIISAVLLPLSFGYYAGGRSFKSGEKSFAVRKKLIKNILVAMLILSIGLSYPLLELFFGALELFGVHNHLLKTAIYSVIFTMWPIFLLGQTIPLVSNYFSSSRLSEITGKMLSFSTVGSFLGSVFSTIVLTMIIGVHNTVILTIALLAILVLMLARRKYDFAVFQAALIWGLVAIINSDYSMSTLHVVENNSYNLVKVTENKISGDRLFNLNRSFSSSIDKDGKPVFKYIKYIEGNFIKPILKSPKPKNILVIGAGGFTLGIDDAHNNYTYVDIDGQLKDVAEKYFLKHKILPNKKFIASSARAFVHNSKLKYDMIVIDVYSNYLSIPAECITREFLQDVKNRLNTGGIVISNVIGSPNYSSRFDIRYNNTFGSVFTNYTREILGDYNSWETTISDKQLVNILYIYFDKPGISSRDVYSDDLNTYSLDKNRE